MSKGPLDSHRLAFYSWVCVESRDSNGLLNVRKLRVDSLPLYYVLLTCMCIFILLCCFSSKAIFS
jgi:hypothetical protein